MNDGNIMVGAHCPRCNLSIGMMAAVGSEIKCPKCGGEMESSEGKVETHVIANSECKKCGSKIGLMSVIGGPAKCPNCGSELV